jgi:hypothetical protein
MEGGGGGRKGLLPPANAHEQGDTENGGTMEETIRFARTIQGDHP